MKRKKDNKEKGVEKNMVMGMRREGRRENDVGKASRERMLVVKKERDMKK